MEQNASCCENGMSLFVKKHKKVFLAIYRAVIILTAIVAVIYLLRAKLFVGGDNTDKYLTLIDLVLSPNSTATFGVQNFELLIPTLIVLIPAVYMCVACYNSAYFRFRARYVPHDEEHCSTYKNTKRLKINIAIYLYSLLVSNTISFVKEEGVTYQLSHVAFVLFWIACFLQLWEFVIGYILTDGVAKSNYYRTHEKISQSPPEDMDTFSIYRPDNMVDKRATFYIYIGCVLFCSLSGLVLLLCFPMYYVEKFGVEFAHISLPEYIGQADHMLQSIVVIGSSVAEWVTAVVDNYRSGLLVIGWVIVLVYLIVKLIPYYIMTLLYGMTYQDKRSIASFTSLMLVMSIALWVLTTSEIINLYSLDVAQGIRACWPSLVWMILCIVMKATTSILVPQLRYRTKKVRDANTIDEHQAEKLFFDMENYFVGPGGLEYYIHAFRQGIYWNWSAFFLGVFWLVYRKMYKNAVIYYLAQCAVSLVVSSLIYNGKYFLALLITMIIPLCMGMFGNLWYHHHVEYYVGKALWSRDPALRLEYLGKKGGTSGGAVIVTAFVVFLISIVSAFVSSSLL